MSQLATYPLVMPRISREAAASARLVRWLVKEGQAVAIGDVVAEVAEGKTTIDLEADRDGIVDRLLVAAGTDGIAAETPLALVVEARAARDAHPTPTLMSGFLSAGALTDLPTEGPLPTADHAADLTVREALRDGLKGAMRRDASIIVFGTDVVQNRGADRVTQGLADEFGPERVVTLPALDQGAMGLVLGSALAGMRPVLEVSCWGREIGAIYQGLVTAAELATTSGGALRAPLVVRGPNGPVPGFTGQDARCVASMLAAIPGLTVVMPANAEDAMALLQQALAENGPVAVLEHELLYPTSGTTGGQTPAPGKARILREGGDATLVTQGHAVAAASKAAEALSARGIAVDLIDLRSLRPLDTETVLKSVEKTGVLITVEEGQSAHGIGAEVLARVAETWTKATPYRARRVAAVDRPMPYAAPLRQAALPGEARIIETVLSCLGRD